mmetsp:Transcript_29282/g.58563  ORF Transcript_29282/g.58563 Transcript_29282/m.58563 type:complete len:398 (-) Transcript_29282:586-1779(-)
MIPSFKPHSSMYHSAHRAANHRASIQSPPRIQNTASPTTHQTEWSNARGQVDYFMSGSFSNDSIYRTALPDPSTFVSFSPLRGSGRKSSYPSQELNPQVHVEARDHTPGDSSLSLRSSFHEEIDDAELYYDRKFSPTVPVPPLPPLAPNFHFSPQIKVENVAVTSCNVARMMYRENVDVKLESDEQDLSLNNAYPSPSGKMTDPPTGEVNTPLLDDFIFDQNDIPPVDMIDSIHDDVESSPVGNSLHHNIVAPPIPNQHAEKSVTAKPSNKNKMQKSTTVSRSQYQHAKNSSEADAPAVGIERPNDLDVLRGRGGLTNRHVGNMRFRDEARKLRVAYRDQATSRREKYLLSKELVKRVREYGGRFLEMGADGLWYEMKCESACRKKASQVLREEKWT